MWPLYLLFLFGLSASQQDSPNAPVILQGKLSALNKLHKLQVDIPPQRDLNNTCYTMRSYFFRRQDGQAPVPAGMITCTPASVLQQRQISPRPRVRFVPLGTQPDEEK